MFDDLAAYFYENVATSYVSYLDLRKDVSCGISGDLRAAITAATALFHLREHVPDPYRVSRSAVAKDCCDYDLLGDIVNAAKHGHIDRGNPQISSSENIYEMLVSTSFQDENGEYTDSRKTVMVKLDNGAERDVADVLTNVINYWGCLFVKNRILTSFRPYPFPPSPGEQFVPREEAKGMDLIMMQGVRFRLICKVMKFDPLLGRGVPVDLTGCSAALKVYKPAYSLDVKLKHPKLEKEYSLSLQMSDEDSIDFQMLRTDEDRRLFIKRLAERRHDELEYKLNEKVVADGFGIGSFRKLEDPDC